ncbi:MAG: hypothetical protein KIH69_009565 [Anaerolineae bacterium]|nr:hypothetical protein [Anaerolineae bacterium]
MTYEEWELTVPEQLQRDEIWEMKPYRYALYLFELAWQDTDEITHTPKAQSISDQLLRAISGISESLAHGFSHSNNFSQRSKAYSNALGYGRETRDLYYKLRQTLDEIVFEQRLNFMTRLVPMLNTLANEQFKRPSRFDVPTPPTPPTPPSDAEAPEAPPEAPAVVETEEQPPRRDYDDRPPRRDYDRPPRRDYDRPPPRRDYDRPPRRDYDRPPRRDYDRPPRRDYDRPPRRDDDDRRDPPRW